MSICYLMMEKKGRSMTAHDRTRTALDRQLRGLALARVEITVQGPERTWTMTATPAEVLARLPELKRWNSGGCNLFVRPPRDEDHHLVVLDDLAPFTPERMAHAGHRPAVVVETSPGSLHAWVSLGRPVAAPVRHEIARRLAGIYGGDPGAVDPHHSGRLAGFTNRKPEHRTARGFPFALLVSAWGRPCYAAADLIERGQSDARARAEVETASLSGTGRILDDLAAVFTEPPLGPDQSAADWSRVHRVLAAGADPEDVAAALAASADRKGRHADAYARRTVESAMRERAADPFPADLTDLS